MNRLKVLIADSTASVRQFIKYALEDHFHGVIIEMANSGKNIQHRLESARYDLILYEKEMPMLDGIMLLEWLKKHETLKKIPLILMSADSDEESLKKAVQSGADAYLLKPFKIDNLVHKVTSVVNMINRRKAERYMVEGGINLKTNSQNFRGNIIDMAKESLSCVIERQDPLPHILEKVEACVEIRNKHKVEGIAGFIVRMEAVEAASDIKQIKVVVKFIEDLTPGKKKELEQFLSLIAS